MTIKKLSVLMSFYKSGNVTHTVLSPVFKSLEAIRSIKYKPIGIRKI